MAFHAPDSYQPAALDLAADSYGNKVPWRRVTPTSMHALRRNLIALILVFATVAAAVHVIAEWSRDQPTAALPAGTVVLASPSPSITPITPQDSTSLQDD